MSVDICVGLIPRAVPSASTSFARCLPLLPFIGDRAQPPAAVVAAALAVAALFGIGAVLSLFTGRSAVRGGLRMMLIGAGAGLATWLIGRAIGTFIG